MTARRPAAIATALLAASMLLGCSAKQALTPVPGPGPAAQPTPSTAPSPAPALAPAPEPPKPAVPEMKPVNIHALYMTGYIAGSKKFYDLVDYMQKSGLNAVVIDAKDDDGKVSWETDIPLAKEIGSNQAKITDIADRVKYLKDHGIYTIARIVCYADPLLGKMRPDMAIPNFIDTRGIRWPNPYNHDVWDYNLAIAKNAVGQGFQEIQFDYIRFPEHRIPGFNAGVPVAKRTDAIEGYLTYATTELHKMGAFVSADVFGLTTSVAPGDDMEIGQDYTHLAQIVDYLYPMVYPSHYAPGTYGISDPNADPGGIVYNSLKRALERTPDVKVAEHRPWIQDFKMGKLYTAADIEAQIKGLDKAGIHQWVLWDPNNNYTRDVNYNIAGAPSSLPGTALDNHLAEPPAPPAPPSTPATGTDQSGKSGSANAQGSTSSPSSSPSSSSSTSSNKGQ